MHHPFTLLQSLRAALFALVAICSATPARAADDASVTRRADIIYGRKYGTALTFDLFQPKQNANGIGIIYAVSGGWYSKQAEDGSAKRYAFLLDRGYTVFAVVHGSQPKFQLLREGGPGKH